MNVRLARQSGFTYIGMYVAVVILGITLATAGIVWGTEIRREKEAELLWVGNQYRMAIARYRAAGGLFPQQLTDLVQDERVPSARHFLRRLYPDPMTGQADWQLITVPGGSGILGVASSSHAKPIKVSGFAAQDESFADAECYCDWKFIAGAGHRRLNRAVRPATAG
jgi:type II secretory pathway pseudopilin PulG